MTQKLLSRTVVGVVEALSPSSTSSSSVSSAQQQQLPATDVLATNHHHAKQQQQHKTTTTTTNDYLEYFTEWANTLYTKLESSLPVLDEKIKLVLTSSIQTVQTASTVQQDAQVLYDHIQQQTPVDDVALAAAQKTLTDATTAVQAAWDTCVNISVNMILDNDTSNGSRCSCAKFLSSDYDDSDLILYTILMEATPQGLADYCTTIITTDTTENGPRRVQQIMDTLHNVDIMRLFLQSGGARNGQYGKAIELYLQLQQQQQVDPRVVLQRLALAVSLELADPYPLFNELGTTNAIQRYIHYEQSYLLGELDINFDTFNIWELRHVVNSDATEDELSWGRASLLAYRPDIALSWTDNPQWQYCYIVRTDVSYRDPDFYKSPRSYDQILSGGGKCGPRAWYGRFICKAFGIPTWGVKQPGHAAMARWTPNGCWEICLGAGFQTSWWDDQCGNDFLLETQARNACGTEATFAQQVLRLQWLAAFHKENTSTVRRDGNLDPNNLWTTLGMIQRRHLASQPGAKKHLPPLDRRRHRVVPNKITARWTESLRNGGGSYRETIISSYATGGTIEIPAASCSDPTTSTSKVVFMPSFLGGRQLFVKEDAEIVYTLPVRAKRSTDVPVQYNVICRVATAHRQEQPITLTIGTTTYEIKLPYTMALWGDTDPVSVTVDESSTTLKLNRPMQDFGFSIKDIRLIPV